MIYNIIRLATQNDGIQNTQNRDALAMHLKLDEVIRAIEGADNDMIRAEDETVEELERLKSEYESLYAAHKVLKSKFKLAAPTEPLKGSEPGAASKILQTTNGNQGRG